jgi:hypothetical protein
MATHYKLNLKPLTNTQRSQLSTYSTSMLEFAITDETGQRQLSDISMKTAASI